MSDEQKIDPRHNSTRAVLRVIGPLLVLVGLLFIITGVASLFSSMGSFEPPHYFWCTFVGIPLLAVGAAMCQFGFMGSVFRYMSGEVAPVQKDTFNYLAEGTQPGVRTMARAAGQGFNEGMTAGQAGVECPHCHHHNGPEARFCNQCGAALRP